MFAAGRLLAVTAAIAVSAVLLALASVWLARPAQAANITVNTTADELNADGDCSLREAVQAANTDAAVDACAAGSGPDTITLPAGTLTLSIAGQDENVNAAGDLDVTDTLTVNGAGSASTIVDGDGIDRVFDLPSGGDLTLNGLTVTGGDTTGGVADDGGGIQVVGAGDLTMDDTAVDGNTAADQGGGVFLCCEGNTVTITNSSISGNTATGDQAGGFFHCCDDLQLSISNSDVSNNQAPLDQGGGIFQCCGGDGATTITISGTTITNNDSGDQGGGIFYCCGGTDSTTIDISGTTVDGNTAADQGGGIFYCCGSEAADSISLSDSAFTNNDAAGDGGGIYVCCPATAGTTVTLDAVEVSGNTSDMDGGGISLDASEASFSDSTISGNTAVGFGGGIENTGSTQLSLTNVTINGNTAAAGQGGGLSSDVNAETALLNTIVSNNTSEDCLFESLTSLGHNIDSDDTCGLTAGGDQPSTDPLLEPLALNAPGTTQTHALPMNSPAVDTGDDDGCTAADQRGVTRPQDGDDDGTAVCDIGAYELEGPAPTLTPTPVPATASPTAAPAELPDTGGAPAGDGGPPWLGLAALAAAVALTGGFLVARRARR